MQQTQRPSFSLPRPGKAVLGVMVAVAAIWIFIASSVNWGKVDPSFLAPFVGSTTKVLHGQIWRLVTASLIHEWSGDGAVSHLVTTLFGLYFLAPSLETRWGAKRTLLFLFGSATFAFVCQVLLGALIGGNLSQDVWIGGLGMVDAVAVAWALQARQGEQIRLMFILPVSPMMLVGFIFLMSVLKVFAVGAHPEGLITPFGGMLAGYLFADRSPLRKVWLKLRLRRLQAENEALRAGAVARRKAGGPALRVIHGGAEPPKDKRYLN